MAKYDTIGLNYNQTRKADPYLADRMWYHLDYHHGQRLLDIGCGTGNYTSSMKHKGAAITGVDPSRKMLDTAHTLNPDMELLQGMAAQIPVADKIFDAAMAMLTLHHWPSLTDGFRELNRVLRPRARFVIFTSTKMQMQEYWLKHYFPKMLEDSIKQMPARDKITTALTSNNFEIITQEAYVVRKDLQDKFLYAGKYEPAFYLDPVMRQGISSFSHLANREEVESGLQMLEQDIQSGQIQSIINSYNTSLGDYLFIVAQKAN